MDLILLLLMLQTTYQMINLIHKTIMVLKIVPKMALKMVPKLALVNNKTLKIVDLRTILTENKVFWIKLVSKSLKFLNLRCQNLIFQSSLK